MIRVLSSAAARISNLTLSFYVARAKRFKFHREIEVLCLEKWTKSTVAQR
jgi:hypothetical protein